MSKAGKTSKARQAGDDERVLAEFRESIDGWHGALESHRLAPPDASFSSRLVALAHAAGEQARVYRAAAADYEWVPYSAPQGAPGGKPPYELQPDTGRRGPRDLWERFDHAVERLSATTESNDMLAVAGAYEDLAALASDLAEAIAREDQAGAKRPRTRARRSA
jgi:hypothetical protein